MMDQEKACNLLNRQLTDIIMNADRINEGADSAAELESFSKYSTELKRYVEQRIDNKEIKVACSKISDVNYKRNQTKLWKYIFSPSVWLNFYFNAKEKEKTKTEISIARSQYASLQLLIKGSLYDICNYTK